MNRILTMFLWVFCGIISVFFYYFATYGTMNEDHLEVSNIIEFNVPSEADSVPEVQTENKPEFPRGFFLLVDLDKKNMEVYKDGVLIKNYPVSGGKKSTPSPTGTWKIISKDKWGEGFGGAWMGFNVPWGKYGIHGTIYPWLVGRANLSKGCIRMKNKDVLELYKIVPHGTIVKIVYENAKFRILRSGMIGSDVRQVQDWLKELQYYKGSIDGKFGVGLFYAVKNFQKENREKQTGIVDEITFQKVKNLMKDLNHNPRDVNTSNE